MKTRSKINWKGEIKDIFFALVGALIALLAFNYFKPSIENMLSVMIFMLILILLKQK